MKPALLVLEAASDIGRGVVEAAVAAGRPVIAAAADTAALDALRARHPRAALATLAGHAGSDEAAAALASVLRERGQRVEAAVAAIGYTATAGRLLDQSPDALRRMLDDYLLPQLHAARHLFPLLPRSDRTGYLMVGAAGREHPWAGHGPGSIAAAALPMLARVLHDEAGPRGLRVQLLALTTPVCGDSNRDHACREWPSALSIGRVALALLDRRASQAALPPVVDFAVAVRATAGAAVPVGGAAGAVRTAGAAGAAPSAHRDLRRARALLESITSLPPAGNHPDEEFR